MAQAPTPAERGKAFLAGVLDKIDPAKRAAAEALLEETALVEAVGNGTLRQDEFSRAKDKLAQDVAAFATKQAEWLDWHERAKPMVERAQAIIERAGGVDPALDPDRGDPDMAAIDPKKLEAEIDTRAQSLASRMIAESERNAIPFVATLNDLSMKHYATFGELLDTKALTADPRVYDGKHGLVGTYEAIYGERYAERAKAAHEKELADARAAGAQEAETKLRAQLASAADPRFPQAQPAATPMGEALAAVQKVGDDGKTAPRDFRNRVDERAAASEYATLVAAGQ